MSAKKKTLKIERLNINDVKEHPENHREISNSALKELITSIEEFPEMMEVRPIVIDKDGFAVGGNQRLKACIELGWKEVPVIYADGFTEEIVIMLDDDISAFILLLGKSPKQIKRPELIEQILLNCASNCYDANMKCFSFSQKGDVRKYLHTEPFKLNSWVGTIVGIIGRDIRFTEQNKLKVDADFALQNLLKNRVLWVDERYGFSCHRDNNSGGNGLYRTQDLIEKENEFLKSKWGKYIGIRKQKQKYGLSLYVKRKQTIVV